MNECMNEGRLNYRLISMRVSVYVSLLHDSASGGARTALAPCLETWLAPWLAPCYGSRQPTLYLLAMIWPLLLVGSLHFDAQSASSPHFPAYFCFPSARRSPLRKLLV